MTNRMKHDFDREMNIAAKAMFDEGKRGISEIEIFHRWREMFPGPKVTLLINSLGMLLNNPGVKENRIAIVREANRMGLPNPFDCAQIALETFAGVEKKEESRIVGLK